MAVCTMYMGVDAGGGRRTEKSGHAGWDTGTGVGTLVGGRGTCLETRVGCYRDTLVGFQNATHPHVEGLSKNGNVSFPSFWRNQLSTI